MDATGGKRPVGMLPFPPQRTSCIIAECNRPDPTHGEPAKYTESGTPIRGSLHMLIMRREHPRDTREMSSSLNAERVYVVVLRKIRVGETEADRVGQVGGH
jgi:hypothetical protein